MKLKQSIVKIMDREKRLAIATICIVMLGVIITGCSQPQNNDPSVNNGSDNVQGPVEADIDRQEQLTADIDRKKPIDANINWQELAKGYNPPRIDGLLRAIADSDITADSSIVITADIKRKFNQMGKDYRFFFMPKVAWYDFESTGAALSYMLFTWTGEFGTFTERAPKYEAEARLRKVFAAPNNEYLQLEHQPYRKLVMFDGESYTLWPESYNANTMIYDLVELRVRQDRYFTYYTATANEYGFDLSGEGYAPGVNEKFLFGKAKDLGLDYTATLVKLLENGEISAALKSITYTIEFRTKGDNTTPMIVSIDKL